MLVQFRVFNFSCPIYRPHKRHEEVSILRSPKLLTAAVFGLEYCYMINLQHLGTQAFRITEHFLRAVGLSSCPIDELAGLLESTHPVSRHGVPTISVYTAMAFCALHFHESFRSYAAEKSGVMLTGTMIQTTSSCCWQQGTEWGCRRRLLPTTVNASFGNQETKLDGRMRWQYDSSTSSTKAQVKSIKSRSYFCQKSPSLPINTILFLAHVRLLPAHIPCLNVIITHRKLLFHEREEGTWYLLRAIIIASKSRHFSKMTGADPPAGRREGTYIAQALARR